MWSLVGCKDQTPRLQEIMGEELIITQDLPEIDSLEEFIEPYRSHLDTVLSQTLCYAPMTLAKSDGKYNSALGNLLCEMVYQQGNPIFHSRTGKNIDIVLLNNGGIRAVISAGPVTPRTAYEVMPFENTIEVLELTAANLKDMITYVAATHEPFSGMKIHLNDSGDLDTFSINGGPLDPERTYFVATSNYQANLVDQLPFFKDPVNRYSLDYLIRKAMIDYFEKQDTLAAQSDDRITGP